MADKSFLVLRYLIQISHWEQTQARQWSCSISNISIYSHFPCRNIQGSLLLLSYVTSISVVQLQDAINAITLDKNLLAEREKVNKEKIEHIEKFYKAYASHLHPKHVFLVQLRIWKFQGIVGFKHQTIQVRFSIYNYLFQCNIITLKIYDQH